MSIATGVARYKDGTITYTVFDMSSELREYSVKDIL